MQTFDSDAPMVSVKPRATCLLCECISDDICTIFVFRRIRRAHSKANCLSHSRFQSSTTTGEGKVGLIWQKAQSHAHHTVGESVLLKFSLFQFFSLLSCVILFASGGCRRTFVHSVYSVKPHCMRPRLRLRQRI